MTATRTVLPILYIYIRVTLTISTSICHCCALFSIIIIAVALRKEVAINISTIRSYVSSPSLAQSHASKPKHMQFVSIS